MQIKKYIPFRYNIFSTIISFVLLISNTLIAQVLMYDTLNIKILPVKSVNTKYSEYSPYKFKNQFYFISDRESSGLFEKENVQAGKQLFSNLYKGEMIDSLTVKSIQVAKDEAISNFFIGPFCETTLGYYYTNNQTATKKGSRPLKLQINFIEKGSGQKNKNPVKISFGLNDTISCAHPTVLNDTLMVFACDWQENSQGKRDLFYSFKKNNEWQKPINCGNKINSAFNESFPYLVNGDLYFSSDRKNGFGLLDIYKNKWTNANETTTILPYPINTPFDDFGVCIDSLKDKGFFSSNRNGSDDVFYFENRISETKGCVEMKNNNYCFTFFEEAGIATKDTLGQTYEWSFGDKIKIRGIEVKHCFPKEGKYQVELNVINKSSGQTFYNVLSTEFDLQNERQLFIHSPDSTQTGKTILFDPSYSNIEGLHVNRYIWDFGDGQFAYDEKVKHTYLQDGDYTVKLSVDGFINGKKEMRCVNKKIVTRATQLKDVYLFHLPIKEDE